MTLVFEADELNLNLAKYTADGLVTSNLQGVVTGCNPSFARLIEGTDLSGKHLQTIINCSCLAGDRQDELLLASDESSALHNATITSSKGVDLTMPVSHIAVPDKAGQPGFLITVVYIVQASSVQQAQTEFVSTVSHELRTPLTSIKGFADTILRAGDRLDANQQRRYVGIIKDQADRLTRLVEDLLAVSRLESRKMQLTIRALDLSEAVQRVLRNLADKARDHQITSRIPQGLPPVWADADRLEQILTNLIENAIKYSSTGTTVTISARNFLSDGQEMVEAAIADQGVGIAADHLKEIFNKFSRLDNPLVRQTEGTGLGLYITRSLVLALGGQIDVQSNNNGTTFTVRLPAATLEEQAQRGRG